MKRALSHLAAALLTVAASTATMAQTYPTKPVKIVIPFAPGGGTDVIARLVSEKLQARLGKPIVIDNKPGASAIIGTEAVARAAPDGHTLLLVNNAIVTNPFLYKLSFNTETSFAPITVMATTPNLLVANPSAPFKTVKELIDYAKSKPGEVSVGSSGVGQPSHLAAELLQQEAGIKLLTVQYKGTGGSLADLVGGQIMLSFGTLPSFLSQIKAGKLRPIAVASKERSSALPDVPTVAETVPGFEMLTWFALFAPAKTPKEIIDRLHKEVSAILNEPDIRKRIEEDGFEPGGNTPEQLGEMFRSEMAKWGKVIKEANIKVE